MLGKSRWAGWLAGWLGDWLGGWLVPVFATRRFQGWLQHTVSGRHLQSCRPNVEVS